MTSPASICLPTMRPAAATPLLCQDRLECEAYTQALAHHEVGLSSNDHRHNIASGSHGPRYHQSGRTPPPPYPYTTYPLPLLVPCTLHAGSPYTRMASGHCRPAPPRPALGASPKGKPPVSTRWRSNGSFLLATAHPHSPSGSSPTLQNTTSYGTTTGRSQPQDNSTEAVEALLTLAPPPLSTLVRPAVLCSIPCLRPHMLLSASPCPSLTCAHARTRTSRATVSLDPDPDLSSCSLRPRPPSTGIQPPRHHLPEIQEISKEEYIMHDTSMYRAGLTWALTSRQQGSQSPAAFPRAMHCNRCTLTRTCPNRGQN